MNIISTINISKMQKSEIHEYQLKLGMIIKFIAQSNDNLHNKIFLIDYLDNDIIKIINDDFERFQITINDGKLSDESIEEIHILDEPLENGYAKQHGLNINTWWSFSFGGSVPEVINGEITNLEEDCIEITTYPNKDVIYIDFAYKGIPLNLPLKEPIVPFKPPTKVIFDDDDAEEEEIKQDRDDLDNILFDDDDDELVYEFDNEKINQEKDSLILQADDIKFGEEKVTIVEMTSVSEDAKIYDIETQVNDLLDDLLSVIPTNKRTRTVLRNINVSIDRFKELRQQYSNFNMEGIVTSIKRYSSNYRPLSENLFNLDKPIKWLVPIVKNRLQLYNVKLNDVDNLDITIPPPTTQQFINDHMDIYDLYYSDRIPIEQNKYIYLHEQTLPVHFNTPLDKTNIIIEKKVKNNFEVLIDNLDDLNSSSATIQQDSYSFLKEFDDSWNKQSEIKVSRFNTTKYITGLNYITYEEIKKTKKATVKPLTFNDTISLHGFLMYPLPVINYSKLYLNRENIYNRANLHLIPYINSLYVNDNTFIPRYVLTENQDNEDTEFKDMKKLNKIIFQENNIIDDRSTNETYVEFLNNMIPKTKKLFLNIMKYFKLQDSVSYSKTIDFLEPFLIYDNHITFKQYEEICNFVNIGCNNYLKVTIQNILDMNTLNQNKNIRSYSAKSRLANFFENKDELEKMDEKWYKLDETFKPVEYIKKIINLDNGRLLHDGITLSDISLIQTINIDEKLLELKDKLDNDREKFISDRENTCSVFVLAKKFKNIDEVVSDNGKKEIFFDKELDDTRYDIYNELGHIKSIKDKKTQKTQLIQHLMTELGISAKNAERDSEAMIMGKKIIIEGDYGLLDLGDYEYRYYIRKEDKWHLDEELNDKFIDEINFCNIQKNCININKSCTNKEEGKLMIETELITDIMSKIEDDFKLNLEVLKENLKDSLAKNMQNMILLIKLNRINKLHYDTKKYLLSEQLQDDIEIEVSPYIELRDTILGQTDIIKKNHDILKFVEKFCSYKYDENVENDYNKYWFYCNETNLILLPTFYNDLANAFFNNKYTEVLDKICAERGTISDDGDKVVDKHSGHLIRFINYENVDMYEKSGKKIISHEILDLSIDERRKEEDETLLKEDKAEYKTETARQISNIVETMDTNLGINTKSYHTTIVRLIKDQIDNKLSSVKVYNKKKKEAEKLGKKMQSYDKAYNNLVMYFTLSLYIIIIQISIPHIAKGKGFYGCKESFLGFPLEKEEQYGIIDYITCVSLKLAFKDDDKSTPWSALPKLTKKKAEKYKKQTTDKLTKYIKDVFLNLSEIKLLIKKKKAWLESNEEVVVEELLSEKWNAFLPILEPFEIKKLSDINSSFESSLKKSYKDGTNKMYEHLNALYGKIIYYSLSFQDNMQKIIDKQPLILKTMGDVNFLENTCCDEFPDKTTYEYFIEKNAAIDKHNVISNKLTNLYNKYSKITTPMFNSLEDTKFYYPKDIEEFHEETIYRAIIKYCDFNTGIELNDELKQICSTNISNYNQNDSIKDRIKIMKSEGHSFSNGTLKLLIKIISKKTKKKIEIVDKFHPKMKFEKLLTYLIDKDTIGDTIEKNNCSHIYKKIQELFDRHESHYNEKTDEDVEELKFQLKKHNTEMLSKITGLFKKIKNSRKAIRFLKNLDDFSERGDNFYINSRDETGYFKYKFLLNLIHDVVKIYPSIILKKVSYDKKSITVLKSWKLSVRHNMDITANIAEKYIELAKFYGNESIDKILKKITFKTVDIIELLKTVPFLPEFKDNKTICNGEMLYLIAKYFFLCIFDTHYDIINDIYEEESEDRLIRGKREALELEVSSLLTAYTNSFVKLKKLVNKSNSEINEEVLKIKDKEKTQITTTYEDLTQEQRKVVKVMQNHKLGDWSLGESKAIYMYDKDQYDKEREQMEKIAILEKKYGVRDEVTEMMRDIYDMDDILENEQIQQRINQEEFNISHLPEDDDYGDMDGDEFY